MHIMQLGRLATDAAQPSRTPRSSGILAEALVARQAILHRAACASTGSEDMHDPSACMVLELRESTETPTLWFLL